MTAIPGSQSLSVVITGVTRGLGRAMVDEFVRLGHIVSGCARTKKEIEQLSHIYPHCSFRIVDVSSEVEVKTWTQHLLQQHGAPDLVVNNAAVINSKASLWEVDPGDFSYEIDTNIKGVFNVIRYLAGSMVERKRGVIVNITSRWGESVERQMAPYCATKWAVVALTRAVAEELRPEGVAAVAVNPGIVNTGMLHRYLGVDATPLTIAKYPTPRDWAEMAVPAILQLQLKDSGKVHYIFRPQNANTGERQEAANP